MLTPENDKDKDRVELEHRLTAIEYSLKELNNKFDSLANNIKVQTEVSYKFSRLAIYISITALTVLSGILTLLIIK